MALTKRTYVDDDASKPITAANLNAIQDTIIEHETSKAYIQEVSISASSGVATITVTEGYRGLLLCNAIDTSNAAKNGIFFIASAGQVYCNQIAKNGTFTVSASNLVVTVSNTSSNALRVTLISSSLATITTN